MATSHSAEEIKIRACRGGSYANNLFFKLFFYLFTIVLLLSLILVVRFISICLLFYGSFCSIPLLLLLRRGLFTINLLVFLFTE